MKDEPSHDPSTVDPLALPEFKGHKNVASNRNGETDPPVAPKSHNIDGVVDSLINEILISGKKENQAIWETGKLLTELKVRLTDENCKYGTWGNVIQNELGYNYQTAGRHMRYAEAADKAERNGQIDILLKLSRSVVYAAIEPSAPVGALDEVLQLAADVEKVTMKHVRSIVKKPKENSKTKDSESTATQEGDEDKTVSPQQPEEPIYDTKQFKRICVAFEPLLDEYLLADDDTRKAALEWMNNIQSEFQLVST